MALPLPQTVFVILRGIIDEKLGIHFDDSQRDLLAEKVSGRALERGFDSLLDYYYFLRYDEQAAAEVAALAEHLVVRETYFFRELDQLEMLVRRLLAPMIAAGRRPRVWSAACATGEEPLSLAMLLAERGLLDAVELVASDLSARSLERARGGSFGPRSVRAEPPSAATRWLSFEAEGRVRVAPGLIDRIDWRRINLKEPEQVSGLGAFDVILCRNVLIYFSEETTRRVLESLSAALRPAGVLLVGVSESLLRFGSRLGCEERDGVFYYRKEGA
jgi:chemotaxis protein methyltransferase CheR